MPCIDEHQIAASGLKCADRPYFHPMSKKGWASDPSGPLYYKGRYHMFFQHNPESCQWHWGLGWDHVVSDDLVHWKKLPPAIMPTPGGLDADGCFTGVVEVDPESGLPVIIYTGVYLKTNQEAVSKYGLPAPEHDLQLRFVETQLAAVPEDPDDPDLTVWRKLPDPVIRYPPANIPLSCWRDPCFLQKGDPATGKEWIMLMCSGVRDVGGTVIAFKSKHLLSGWEYVGMIIKSEDKSLGIDWECPILTELYQDGPQGAKSTEAVGSISAKKESTWLFGMSPDACNNPVYYWLGDFDGKYYDVAAAHGPCKMDLGKTLYAATHWTDPKGRQMLIGWIQEHKRVTTPPAVCKDFIYAGCLSIPRVVTLKDGRLFQSPLPEIEALRTDMQWEASHLVLAPTDAPYPLPMVSGNHLDIMLELEPPVLPESTKNKARLVAPDVQMFSVPGLPLSLAQTVLGSTSAGTDAAEPESVNQGEAAAKVGLILSSWRPGGEGAAIVSFDWATHSLTVDFDEAVPHAYDPFPDPTKPGAKQVGGRLSFLEPGQPLQLRILIDGSAVEIFTSTGEVLTTRTYRKTTDKPAPALDESRRLAEELVQDTRTEVFIKEEDFSRDVEKAGEHASLPLTAKLLEADAVSTENRAPGSDMIKAHLGPGEGPGSTSDDDMLVMKPLNHGCRSSSCSSIAQADSLLVDVPSEVVSIASADDELVAQLQDLVVDDTAWTGPAGKCTEVGAVVGEGSTAGAATGVLGNSSISAAGVYLFAAGSEAVVRSICAWEMKSCWVGTQIDE